jgi:hypothetical protein
MKPMRIAGLLFAAAIFLFLLQAPAQNMMSEHQQMMAQLQDVGKLIDRVAQSYAGLENEKEPVVLKKKLAEHGALVKELQTKFHASPVLMEHMGGHPMHMMDEHSEKESNPKQTPNDSGGGK